MDYGKIALSLAMERPKGLVSVASRGKWYDKQSNGTDIDVTYRSIHEALCGFNSQVLMYGNFYNDGRTTGLSPYKINVSVDIDGTTYPVFFDNGQTHKTVPPGGRVLSDELQIYVPPVPEGSPSPKIFVRTHVVVNPGEKYPVGLTLAGGSNIGEGIMPGDVTTGTFTSTTPTPLYGLTPLALYGRLTASSKRFKTVGLCGDSISVGAGRTVAPIDGRPAGEVGFMQIGALRAGWGYLSIGMNGQKASDFVSPARRMHQMHMIKDCDLVIVEYGTNDLNAGRTFEQLKADLLAIHQAYWEMGIPTVQTTIAPRTNSTDGWSTLEGQTPAHANTAGGPDSVRSRINGWIRNNSDNIRCIEIADIWESARNSGLWKVNPSLTSDGIHPNNQGHDNAAANAVRDYLLRL
ncbi:SGNH/GDSL hydrolase family protein [Paenibacillus lautus]|uniref:SGNH/GDSL hydrolase family protein n=1 Tax=Paenibacillus lautus TaxID=1401 RepID=UPI003D2D9860